MSKDHNFLIREASDRHGRMDVFYLDENQLVIEPTPRPLLAVSRYLTEANMCDPEDWIVLWRHNRQGDLYWAQKGRVRDILASAPGDPDKPLTARSKARSAKRAHLEAAADPITSPSQED